MAVKPGTVTLAWADGEYPFRLANGEWQELYRKILKLLLQLGITEEVAMSKATPISIYQRIGGGNPLPGEVGEVLFQGLIGAGMPPKDAVALRLRYCTERPLLESVPQAQAILLAGLTGPAEPDVKKKKLRIVTGNHSPSEKSMATAQPSDTRREKSTT